MWESFALLTEEHDTFDEGIAVGPSVSIKDIFPAKIEECTTNVLHFTALLCSFHNLYLGLLSHSILKSWAYILQKPFFSGPSLLVFWTHIQVNSPGMIVCFGLSWTKEQNSWISFNNTVARSYLVRSTVKWGTISALCASLLDKVPLRKNCSEMSRPMVTPLIEASSLFKPYETLWR